MGRQKAYIERSVYEESKNRIRYLFDTHDEVVVAFSGGKDSMVAMHLTYEVAQEYGLDYVNVEYRDEEIVPQPVWEHAQWYYTLPWVRMQYLTCQWEATSFMLGRVRSYLQWDERRDWVRPKPPFSITLPGTFDELNGFDRMTAELFSEGKVALIIGVRAEESMNRYRSVVNRIQDNWISQSRFTRRLNVCKPVYDWRVDDIFKYIYDNDLKYTQLYNLQMWAGDNLRVCSPLHATPAKQLHKVREIDPMVYEQIMSIFPEMAVQERYWREFSVDKVIEHHGNSWPAMRDFIMQYLEEDQQRIALNELSGVYARWERTPDSYPLAYVFRHFVTGKYLSAIQPLGKKAQESYRD